MTAQRASVTAVLAAVRHHAAQLGEHPSCKKIEGIHLPPLIGYNYLWNHPAGWITVPEQDPEYVRMVATYRNDEAPWGEIHASWQAGATAVATATGWRCVGVGTLQREDASTWEIWTQWQEPRVTTQP